jgi:FlaA1/EpsC-like NDP-sugar epimerase
VVPLFRDQISKGGPVTVTHPDVRRYFMTIREAVGLVLKAAYGDYGVLCVLNMGEQIKIVELARHMITMAGSVPDLEIPIEFTGLRPGEKLFEELLTEDEERTHKVTDMILVASCPPTPRDLPERIERLIQLAVEGDDQAVRHQLRVLLPSFVPATYSQGGNPTPSSPRSPAEADAGQDVGGSHVHGGRPA